MSDRDTRFAEYFASRSGSMRGTAFLLCGDWHRAEDLVQETFTKLYLAWKRIDHHEALDQYTRKILVRTFLSQTRRGWFKREQVTDTLPDVQSLDGHRIEDQMELMRALEGVPPKQRAVLVLRFWEDMSIEQTGNLLNCSSGTVKSQASRGLQTLRGLLGADYLTTSLEQEIA
ncbi:SigE family RNA polymerase sigma factor [Pseudonocardiaceae bacterium YIM PH 21723]|nr:SigE family RNA polymerase sigma factor [Pseudonocardiaceae bacterium YIM PH 21723]